MPDPERTGPLSDVTIIDCTQALAGPFGTALIADMGANVIKVESPRGDTFRALPPFPPDYAHVASDEQAGADYGAPFASVNRNKRSICLDLKRDEDKEALLQLCEQADAIVENMRAGVMDNLGLSYETISKRNPRIVYGAVRGFGDPRTAVSPYVEWPCLDVAGQSLGGIVDANDGLITPSVADVYPGTLMALGLLAAIYNAKQSGRGQFFDVAMYDSMLTLLRNNVGAFGFTNVGGSKGTSSRGVSLMPFGLFPTSDGQVAIAAPQPNHWERLCKEMDRPDLLTDKRTRSNGARTHNVEYTEEQISAWTRTKTKQEVFRILGGKVPIGPAQNMEEIFNDPHIEARGMLDRYTPPGDNPEVTIAAGAIKFAGTPANFHQPPPLMGEHTDEILAEFGIERTPPDDA